MVPRVAIAVLALITGGYQLADGIHVLTTGKYIGPETPGPWRHVVQAGGFDPFTIGPVFVVLGAAWLASATFLVFWDSTAAWWSLLITAVLTLWYLPVGTITSLATIVILILA